MKTYETRSVPLPSFLVEALAGHLVGLPVAPDQFVFTSPDGGPLTDALDAAGRVARPPDPPSSSATEATIHTIGEDRKRRAR
jgi:hypothetical protein